MVQTSFRRYILQPRKEKAHHQILEYFALTLTSFPDVAEFPAESVLLINAVPLGVSTGLKIPEGESQTPNCTKQKNLQIQTYWSFYTDI